MNKRELEDEIIRLRRERDKLQAELNDAYVEMYKQRNCVTAVYDRDVWIRAGRNIAESCPRQSSVFQGSVRECREAGRCVCEEPDCD